MSVGAVFRRFSPVAACAAALLYCAAALNFSPVIQRFHQSDTLLFGLMSTLRWTPFYWHENRLGNLAPLLALGFHDPEWSVLFQTQIHVLACLACLFLVGCLCTSAGKELSGESLLSFQILVALAAFMIPIDGQSVPSLFLGEPFALSLSLILSALLIAVRPPRWTAGLRFGLIVVLSLLAFWTYIPHVVLAAVILTFYPADRTSRIWAGMAILSAAIAVFISQKLTPGPAFAQLASPIAIPHAVKAFYEGSIFLIFRERLAGTAVAGIALLLLRRRSFERAPFALLAGAAALFTLAVSSEWARINSYNPRFLTSVAILLIALCCYPLARELSRLTGKAAPAVCVASSLVLMGAATLALGFPSSGNARRAIETVTGVNAADISALECSHLVGDYWRVWPPVVYRGAHPSGRELWAVTHRSQATSDLWSASSAPVYCGLCGDGQIEPMRLMFGLPPLVEEARSAAVCRYKALSPDLK